MERDLPRFKVLFIGPAGVGKTSLMMKYVFGKFSYDYQVTTGVECKTKEVPIN
jgi:GTPase SAR1 family protein